MRTFSIPQCRPWASAWIAVGLVVYTATTSVQGALPIQRVPNPTLQLPQTPPVFDSAVANAFGPLTFTVPVAITSPPGKSHPDREMPGGIRAIIMPARGVVHSAN